MRLGVVVLAALALAPAFAPHAAAGSEVDPDVPGIPDLEDPALDFLGAWFERAPGGILFTVKFGGAEDAPPDHYYAVTFTWRGERHVAIVAFDEEGRMRTDVRATNFNRQGVAGPEDLDDSLEDAAFRPGEPAYVSALIPYEALPGLGPGKVIIDLGGWTGFYDRTRRGGWNDVDGRDTQNAYVVQDAYLPVAVERNLGWIALATTTLFVGAIGAIVLLVRRHRKALARLAAPPASIAHAPPPEPRARQAGDPKFRIDPRK